MPTFFETQLGFSNDEIQKIVDLEFASSFCRKMGYDWPDERAERVADDARAHLTKGCSAPFAFACAIENELAMYGDGSSSDPVGLVSVPSK